MRKGKGKFAVTASIAGQFIVEGVSREQAEAVCLKWREMYPRNRYAYNVVIGGTRNAVQV